LERVSLEPEDDKPGASPAHVPAEAQGLASTSRCEDASPPAEEKRDKHRRHNIAPAQTAAAEFQVTGNAVYAWDAIQACLDPDMEQLPLPSNVRQYLYTAAKGIVDAATHHHKAFGATALQALTFAGKQGASQAREYAKLQSQEILIRIYDALKERHGWKRAEELMGEAMRITADRVRARLREARRTREKVSKQLYGDDGVQHTPGAQSLSGLPDALLLNLASGVPDLFWRRHRAPKRAEPRPK
jgi:hypothetical protein